MQRPMQACLAIDLTRLITRLRHANPTGIDRVDLAYARHVLGGGAEGTRFGLVSTAFGPRVLDRETARGIVESVAAGWVEDVAAEADPVYRALAASLGSGPAVGLAADHRPPQTGKRRGRAGWTGAGSRPRPACGCCARAASSACPRARSIFTPRICGSTGRGASTGSTPGATCGRSSSSTT